MAEFLNAAAMKEIADNANKMETKALLIINEIESKAKARAEKGKYSYTHSMRYPGDRAHEIITNYFINKGYTVGGVIREDLEEHVDTWNLTISWGDNL